MNPFARLTLVALACTALGAKATDEEAIAMAKQAARTWLVLADAGSGAGSWQASASLFKARVPQDAWETALAAARGPLGGLKERTLSSAHYSRTLPGAPDGEYVVLQYASRFANKASASETVTPMREPDGSWKVSGYYIK